MTAEGHLLFSIACAVFAKNVKLTPALVHGDWWHIIPSTMLTCLLPDIDHPKSFLGRRLKCISRPISRIFGHRGFTHSLLVILAPLIFFYLKAPNSYMFPIDAIHGMVLGYISHILADMLTPAGVPLLWPYRCRFRLPILAMQKGNKLELVLCTAIFAYAIYISQNISKSSLIHWSSQMINTLQSQFDYFINLIQLNIE